MKRKVSQPLPPLFTVAKQLRSKFPRGRRSRFSPVLFSNSIVSQSFANSSSHLTTSFSCNSSKASSANKQQQPQQQKKHFTRAYSKKQKAENVASMELSESSCVESCSEAVVAEVSRNRALNFNSGEAELVNASSKKSSEIGSLNEISSVQRFSGEALERDESLVKNKRNEVVSKQIEGIEDSETFPRSGISSVSKLKKNSSGLADNDIVSLNSVKFCNENGGDEVESAAEGVQKPNVANEYDLACSEHFSNDDVLEDLSQSSSYSCSYSSAYSEMQSEILLEWNSSEYTPSIWYDSGSQFSDKSDPDTCPSLTFQLFRQFSQEFCRSSIALESPSKNSSLQLIQDYASDDIFLLGLEDTEDEESYRMIRSRERRQMYLRDYAAEYCSSTDYGALVIQQRLQMVHWIVEESTNKELQKETMFLGVNLFDRFLSKGYFKTKRNLQIAGIACLTLATRLEENQPYNSVRQKTFFVGNTAYSRSEVVAMEWLVQEVLNFQCFLPTMYNFLWFYLKAAKANEDVEKTTKYLAVLVLLGHEQLYYWPSTIAASLVILASVAAHQGACCHLIRESHAGQKEDDLPECLKSLEWLVKYIC